MSIFIDVKYTHLICFLFKANIITLTIYSINLNDAKINDDIISTIKSE
jgi:hypothetical protein